MTDLRRAFDDYIALRRSLGFKLGPHPRLLADFVAYLEAARANTISIQLAVSWAAQPPDGNPVWWSQRLGVVRGFATHLRAFDPDTEVPPAGLLPRRSYRPEPYVYLPAEIAGLMATARATADPLRAATVETLIGLIASCGLRPGEGLSLERNDLDWTEGLLDIRNAKFNKHRKVPLHPRTLDALAAYAQVRDRFCPCPSSATFFVSKAGTRLIHANVDRTFAAIATRAGLPRPGTTRPPRLHDLRNFFAIPTVVSWYRAGLDGHQRPAAAAVRRLGPCRPGQLVLVFVGHPRLVGPRRQPAPARQERTAMSALAPSLQAWFTERLANQLHASPNTVAAYRDAWRLLLGYLHQQTGKQPSQLDLADLDAATISAFLDHLEADRHNSVRTRNARLAAIRSFFKFASLRHPEHAALIAHVLAIPTKRGDHPEVNYLNTEEITALVDSPDPRTWTGRRDRALIDLAVQTGLRVSELTGLRNSDIELGVGAHVRCTGKGRKNRCTPLTKETVAVLRTWTRQRRGGPDDPLFPSQRGAHLSRAGVEEVVAKHATAAARTCPSIANKHPTPHVLRHSCAMELLRSGVDVAVISLWLGHESIDTTMRSYLHGDMSIKERALARTAPRHTKPGRYRPADQLLAFLDSL